MTKRPLVPCAACECHVRAGESRCPFCGATGSIAAAPLMKVPTGRLSSLLIMTFQAAAATGAIGCGGDTSDPGPSSGGAAGRAGAGGSSVLGTGGEETGSGGKPTGTGGSANTGGTGGVLDFGTGGSFFQGRGGAVPIYRATPRG